jgi:hypothetical protein
MDNGHARERVRGGVGSAGASSGAVCGWVGISACVGKVDAGDASEGDVRPTRRAMRTVTRHSWTEVVPSCWTNGTVAKTGLAINGLKRRMGTSAWLLVVGNRES